MATNWRFRFRPWSSFPLLLPGKYIINQLRKTPTTMARPSMTAASARRTRGLRSVPRGGGGAKDGCWFREEGTMGGKRNAAVALTLLPPRPRLLHRCRHRRRHSPPSSSSLPPTLVARRRSCRPSCHPSSSPSSSLSSTTHHPLHCRRDCSCSPYHCHLLATLVAIAIALSPSPSSWPATLAVVCL